MKTNYLFPYQFKKIGWIILIPVSILGILWLIFDSDQNLLKTKVFAIMSDYSETDFFEIIENDISDEIIAILLIVSSVFIVFSKEKKEDEYTRKIRLDSLVWAIYVNYIILLLSMILVYDFPFFWVLVFNMFTILIFFIIRFNWALYKSKNQIQDEE